MNRRQLLRLGALTAVAPKAAVAAPAELEIAGFRELKCCCGRDGGCPRRCAWPASRHYQPKRWISGYCWARLMGNEPSRDALDMLL